MSLVQVLHSSWNCLLSGENHIDVPESLRSGEHRLQAAGLEDLVRARVERWLLSMCRGRPDSHLKLAHARYGYLVSRRNLKVGQELWIQGQQNSWIFLLLRYLFDVTTLRQGAWIQELPGTSQNNLD